MSTSLGQNGGFSEFWNCVTAHVMSVWIFLWDSSNSSKETWHCHESCVPIIFAQVPVEGPKCNISTSTAALWKPLFPVVCTVREWFGKVQCKHAVSEASALTWPVETMNDGKQTHILYMKTVSRHKKITQYRFGTVASTI